MRYYVNTNINSNNHLTALIKSFMAKVTIIKMSLLPLFTLYLFMD